MPQTPEFFRQLTQAGRQRRNDGQTARNLAQTELARETEQIAINDLLNRICNLSHQITDYRNQLELKNAILDAWRDRHTIFTESDKSPAHFVIAAFFLLAIYIAALGLDIFFLSGNAKLIAKDAVQGIQALIYLTMVAVPLFILLFEAYFQTQWTLAENRGQRWLWGFLSVLMCILIPGTIIALSLAITSNPVGARSSVVQNWHIIGKAVIAFFVHAGVLLGGHQLHEAKMYAVFKLKEKWLVSGIGRLERKIQRTNPILINTFTDYYQQLNIFNTTHLQNRIEPGPFDEITRNEINRAFGYVIIAAPPAPNQSDNNGDNNPQQNGGALQNPPTNTGNNQPNNNLNGGDVNHLPPIAPNQNNQPNGNRFLFNMDGEDEVHP